MAELKPPTVQSGAHARFSTQGIVGLAPDGTSAVDLRNSAAGGLTDLFVVGYEEEL